MPMNPLLQTLIDRTTTPLVPQSAIQGTQDALTQPSLTQSPTMARIKGFGAGALQGLRDQTSPLGLANIASLAAGPVAGLAGRFLGGMPQGAEVVGTLPQLQQSLTSFGRMAAPAVTRGARVAETLGETLPEFTPVGGEGMFNAARAGAQIPRGPIPTGTPAPGAAGGGMAPMSELLKQLASRAQF